MNGLSTVGTTSPFAMPLVGGNAVAIATIAEPGEEIPLPTACTLQDLFARIYVGTANAYQVSVTLYENGSPTALACSTGTTSATTGSTATCNDTAHTVSGSAGDTFAWQIQPNSSNNNNRILIGVLCK
jgi:hypothetical protein